LSNIAESEPSESITGRMRARSAPKSAERSVASRARIQLTFPRSVLISPLWLMKRYGCARDQDGNVFVENREWTIAIALARVGSPRSG
jgi:hypothetical protein